MKLSLDKIRLDGGTQPRAELRLDTISDYAEAMNGGAQFPPVIGFYDGTEYWLADGFHRLRAWKQAFPGEAVDTDVRQGTQADAQWFSYSVNQTHGLRRTNEDKQRAAKAALLHAQGASKSDREIARHVGVDHKTVSRCRASLEPTGEIPQSPKRQGKDGRTINTAKIGQSRKRKKVQAGNSTQAAKPIVGFSEPSQMIAMQFSPRSPRSAAATLWQLFPRPFIEQLVEQLTHRLSQGDFHDRDLPIADSQTGLRPGDESDARTGRPLAG